MFQTYKKSIVYTIGLLTLIGCCKPENLYESELTEYEKSLIPYESYSSIDFVDNLGNPISARTQLKELKLNAHQNEEECDYETFEYLSLIVRINYNDLILDINIGSFKDNVSLNIQTITPHPRASYSLTCFGDHSRPIENKLTDVSIFGFEYQDVFVFEDCNQGSEISRIIYSPKRGIELIEFESGAYIKLI
jgi:hypothetical protein